jgi:hypothetical protein
MIQATSTRSRLALGTSFAASMAVFSGRPSGCVTFTVCRTLCLPESAFVRTSLSQNEVVKDKRTRLPPNSNHLQGGKPIGDLRLAVNRENAGSLGSLPRSRCPSSASPWWEYAYGNTALHDRALPWGRLHDQADTHQTEDCSVVCLCVCGGGESVEISTLTSFQTLVLFVSFEPIKFVFHKIDFANFNRSFSLTFALVPNNHI